MNSLFMKPCASLMNDGLLFAEFIWGILKSLLVSARDLYLWGFKVCVKKLKYYFGLMKKSFIAGKGL